MAELKIVGGSSTQLSSAFKGRGNLAYNIFQIGYNGDFNNIISIKFIDYDTKEELKDVELLVISKSTNTSMGYSKTNYFQLILPDETTASKTQGIITYYGDTTDLSSITEFKTEVRNVLPVPIKIFQNEKIIDKNNPTTFRVKRYGDDDVSIIMIPNNSTIDLIYKTYNAPYYEYEFQININSVFTNTSYKFYIDWDSTQYGEEYGNALIGEGRQEIKYTVVNRELVSDIEATITSTTPISTEFKGVNLIVDVNYIDDNEKDIPQLLYNNEEIDIIPQVINTIDNESNIYNYSYIIPPEYTDEDIKITFQGYNTNKEITVKNIVPMAIIKTSFQSTNELPSGGGSVEINVEYENYDTINTPSIYIDGEEKDYSLYLSPKSIMAGDIYNYVFDFPATTKEQIIDIILSAYLGEEETRQSYLITQNAPTGNPDIDNPEIKSELILSRYVDEVNNNSQEYYVNSLINLPLNEEVGEVRATVSVDWLVVENDGGGVNDFPYYKELQNEWYIGIEQNNNEESRLAEITFGYYDINGNLVDSKKLMLLQNGTLYSNNKEYRSVWEDIILEVDADTFNYKVIMCTLNNNDYTDNSNIFEGRAYKYPNADTIKIKMNKIFENYLSNSFVPMIEDVDVETIIKGDIDTYEYNFEAGKRFLIINRDTNEVVKEYVVLYDWNYKYKWRGEDAILSKPINSDNAINMIELKTTVNKLGVVTNYFNNENKINSCGNYCLYYLNSNGGWDVLLFNNKVKKTKNINSYTTERYFSRLNVDFEQMKYISELQNNYVFNTNFLTDEQAKNLVDNLFTSNEVYIHDLKENIIYSALITDNNVVYKKYSDDLNLVQYSINIKESQIQLKR